MLRYLQLSFYLNNYPNIFIKYNNTEQARPGKVR